MLKPRDEQVERDSSRADYMTLSQQLTEAKAVLKELWERRPTDPNFLVLGDRIRKVLEERAVQEPGVCTAGDKFAKCNFRRTGRWGSCNEPGGCLDEAASTQ